MAHGIDAVVKGVEITPFQPGSNQAGPEAAIEQLPPRDHTMLSARQLTDHSIRVLRPNPIDKARPASSTYLVLDAGRAEVLARHGAMLAWPGARVARAS